MKRLRILTQPFLLGLSMRSSTLSYWKQAPCIRLLPGFIAGILLQYYLPHTVWIEWTLIALILLFILLLHFFSAKQKYKLAIAVGVALHVLLISFGSICIRLNTVTHNKNWIGNMPDKKQLIHIQLLENPIERKKSFKTTANIISVSKEGRWIAVKGKLLLYLSKEKKNQLLQKGDQLLIRQPLQPIEKNIQPGAFDYAAYLSRKQIHHRLFLKTNQYQRIDTGRLTLLDKTSASVLSIIRKYITGKQEQAIAEALVIGYTFDLEDELLAAYSKTGVIHVIAISGMHLGLIYGILLLLTNPLKRNRHTKWLRPLILLVVLWGFSFLVGAGASVLRASVIFTFMITGEWLQRKNTPGNSLAASMFCLLCFNPFYIWDMGFLLSYAAVTGIMIFTKPLYRYWYTPYKPLRYCWQLLVVTCSAQVFTIPIILYHFHQFPNLFLLTNMMIVPLSGLVLYGCLLLLIVSPLNVIAVYFGKLLNSIFWLMNQIVMYTERLSFAVTDHIQVNGLQIGCYLLLMLFFCRWILYKKGRYLIYGLTCICTGMATYAYRHIQIRQKQQLVIYQLGSNPVTEWIGGGELISIADSAHLVATQKMRSGTHTLLGGFRQKAVLSPKECPILNLNGRQIVFLTNKTLLKASRPVMRVDLVILQNNAAISLTEIQQVFKPGLYVWDTNNPLWKIGKWKKEADSLHLRHYSVPDQGTLVMEF